MVSRRKIGWRCAVTVVMKNTRSESIARLSGKCEGIVCERYHKVLCKSRNGTRGLKAGSSFSAFNAALKGPLFHDVISGIARGECITWIELVEERRFSAA